MKQTRSGRRGGRSASRRFAAPPLHTGNCSAGNGRVARRAAPRLARDEGRPGSPPMTGTVAARSASKKPEGETVHRGGTRGSGGARGGPAHGGGGRGSLLDVSGRSSARWRHPVRRPGPFTRSEAAVSRRAQEQPICPSKDRLTWFSCSSPPAARAAREHAPQSARGPPGGVRAAREGSRHPCAFIAPRAFLVRSARAEIGMRHSVHVHRTRAHEPPRPPPPRGAGRHGRFSARARRL